MNVRREPSHFLLIALLGASGLLGCLSQVEPDVGELRAGTCQPRDSDPARDVSFKKDVLPLFQRPGSQGGCTCHQPSNRSTPGIEQSGLSLESYGTLLRGGNNSHDTIVTAGDPCTSLIVQKVSSAPPTGARMPPGGPPFLTPDEIALLSDWIFEGANDN
ncbi:MAG: c-type cytochrome domain-containing protein [Polyangiales bacterium]